MLRLSEKATNFWTIVLGAITGGTLVAGSAIAYFQYSQTKQKDSDSLVNERASLRLQEMAARLAAKQVFISKRFELCEQASKDASTLANVNQTDQSG
jgi:hypothetical protein